eukprot:4578601-Pleurochrysis_carterae.AAC.1
MPGTTLCKRRKIPLATPVSRTVRLDANVASRLRLQFFCVHISARTEPAQQPPRIARPSHVASARLRRMLYGASLCCPLFSAST